MCLTHPGACVHQLVAYQRCLGCVRVFPVCPGLWATATCNWMRGSEKEERPKPIGLAKNTWICSSSAAGGKRSKRNRSWRWGTRDWYRWQGCLPEVQILTLNELNFPTTSNFHKKGSKRKSFWVWRCCSYFHCVCKYLLDSLIARRTSMQNAAMQYTYLPACLPACHTCCCCCQYYCSCYTQ